MQRLRLRGTYQVVTNSVADKDHLLLELAGVVELGANPAGSAQLRSPSKGRRAMLWRRSELVPLRTPSRNGAAS